MPHEAVPEMTVYLLRHGQTRLNASARLRGRCDVALDDTGRRQAQALGRLFEGVGLRRVVASPLRRARHTAEPVARGAGVGVEINQDLNDRDYGAWAGELVSEVERRFGSIDAAPGVESWQSLERRIHEAFETLVASGDGPIAVVGHDAVNRALLHALMPELADRPQAIAQRTGCWNKLIRRRGDWQAVVLNARAGYGSRP